LSASILLSVSPKWLQTSGPLIHYRTAFTHGKQTHPTPRRCSPAIWNHPETTSEHYQRSGTIPKPQVNITNDLEPSRNHKWTLPTHSMLPHRVAATTPTKTSPLLSTRASFCARNSSVARSSL